MSMGKPVIATGYSGNLELMNAVNSLLVNYDLIEPPDAPEGKLPIYGKGCVWADPHVDHAASHMRWVYEHPSESRSLGERGRDDVQRILDPKKTQAEILARVHEIYGKASS
jgi:hypothetical protein